MQPSENEHIGAAILEAYSLQKLDSEALEATERHLLVCADCCAKLTRIEPFNFVHYTKDGPFHSRVTLMRSGLFFAHHWGCQIDGGGRYPDAVAAGKYLLASFAQMFPEHQCCEDCGCADATQARA
jgi:hypothetical protein